MKDHGCPKHLIPVVKALLLRKFDELWPNADDGMDRVRDDYAHFEDPDHFARLHGGTR